MDSVGGGGGGGGSLGNGESKEAFALCKIWIRAIPTGMTELLSAAGQVSNYRPLGISLNTRHCHQPVG